MTAPTELRPLGRTGLQVTALGLGTAPLGGLFSPVAEADARAVLALGRARGLRYFDTAPMYGLGKSERLTGDALRGGAVDVDDAEGIVLSTKVGRLMVADRAGLDLPPAPPKNPFDTGWKSGLPFRELFDYSYDGIMRSFDDSRQRLGRTRIDILYVHDIGALTHGDRHAEHWSALTTGGGFRALEALREAGDIAGFGLGVNEVPVIEAALEEADLDVCLLAGRYSLLDRRAEPLLARAKAEGFAIVCGGVFNSGILAAPRGTPATFDYVAAPREVTARVGRMHDVCDDHGVPLAAAAVQFAWRNAGVSSIAIGARSAAELQEVLGWAEMALPEALWADLDAGVTGD